MTIKERYAAVLAWFADTNPDPRTELTYSDPFSLLVAVILSAQCTDKRVNTVTPSLLAAFPTPAAMAAATPEEIYSYIRSVSYPNSKTRALIGMAQALVTRMDSKVPDTMETLLTLPGVGRKTANVILSVIHSRPAMAVDTHVHRVSARIGLTNRAKTPLDTERALTAHIPPEIIPKAHHWLILHGRYTCKARTPLCDTCGLTAWCRYWNKKNKPRP